MCRRFGMATASQRAIDKRMKNWKFTLFRQLLEKLWKFFDIGVFSFK